MKKVTEYMVIAEDGLDKFIPAVNDAISKGWQPIGGICSYQIKIPQNNYDEMILGIEYNQAMVRYGDTIDLNS